MVTLMSLAQIVGIHCAILLLAAEVAYIVLPVRNKEKNEILIWE